MTMPYIAASNEVPLVDVQPSGGMLIVDRDSAMKALFGPWPKVSDVARRRGDPRLDAPRLDAPRLVAPRLVAQPAVADKSSLRQVAIYGHADDLNVKVAAAKARAADAQTAEAQTAEAQTAEAQTAEAQTVESRRAEVIAAARRRVELDEWWATMQENVAQRKAAR